jgi:hypothetical protein
MKNAIPFFIFALFCFQNVRAQGFTVGALGGINGYKSKPSEGLSGFYETGMAAYPRFGFQGGLRLGWEIGPRVSLVSDIAYVRKGTIWESDQLGDIDDINGNTIEQAVLRVDGKYSAIHAPLLARVKVLGDRFGLTAMAGLSFNFHFKGKLNATAVNSNGTYAVGYATVRFGKRALDDFNNFDLSLVLAPGFIYSLDEDDLMRLTLDARFDIGTIGMFTEKQRRANDVNGNLFHRGTTLDLGFEYCLTCYR